MMNHILCQFPNFSLSRPSEQHGPNWQILLMQIVSLLSSNRLIFFFLYGDNFILFYLSILYLTLPVDIL